ncbi:hemolysin family protein [Rhizosphaericola mali]|uniref:HlyC/CorC family transporter n=1 Tax=Rhizosphaericola mali TaxID=2545455 RepID=A0A5P2GAJ4_9BACT|nr:hemolysin family protein [Rhizosphaericola mali]QES90203.1 HlyC/CorC family transporter [Rhizosphaericola mali]
MTQRETILGIIIILLCILFFAGMEIAFVTANKLNIELKKKQGKSSGLILSRFTERPSNVVATMMACLTLSLIIYGLLVHQLLRTAVWMPIHLNNEYLTSAFNFIIAFLVAILFGRLLPRTVFSRNDKLLYFFSPLLQLFVSIFSPIITIFVGIAKGILIYLFNVNGERLQSSISKAKIDQFYRIGKKLNEDKPQSDGNARMFENALSLTKTSVRQCLVPRTEVIALPLTTSINELHEKFLSANLSKIVIFGKDIDDIVGYVHQLDLFKRPTQLKDILLPVFTVPQSMSALDLMSKFSLERKSLAWVVDEFGGTAGIVTKEDILTEIFGDIHDTNSSNYLVEKKLSDREFIFSGRIELDYLNSTYDLDFPAAKAETLSGYIINHNKQIPKLNQRIIIDDYEFEILSILDTRIDKVQLKVLG